MWSVRDHVVSGYDLHSRAKHQRQKLADGRLSASEGFSQTVIRSIPEYSFSGLFFQRPQHNMSLHPESAK